VRLRLVPATLAVAAAAALGGSTLLAGPAGAASIPNVTSTTLSVSPATVTAGHDSAALLTATVRGEEAIPSGQVAMYATTLDGGNQLLCFATLTPSRLLSRSGAGNIKAVGSCRMPDTSLPAGTWQLRAMYSGSPFFADSTSTNVPLTVSP
jgi:hypothetical protein